MLKGLLGIGKEIIWGLGDGIKRAVTTAPSGKLVKLLADGETINWPYVAAIAVRVALAILMLWAANLLGVPVEKILSVFGKL